MDDQFLMRVLHGVANLVEEPQAFVDGQAARVRIFIKRLPLDVFHDKVRIAILGRASAQQPANVRMIQGRKDLALVSETAQDKSPSHITLDQLNRDPMLKFSVSAPRLIDRAHSATADFTPNAIGANTATDHRLIFEALGSFGFVRIVASRNYLAHELSYCVRTYLS